MKNKLNSKRRKKMKRKIKRKDIGWEKVLGDVTKYEIQLAQKEKKKRVSDWSVQNKYDSMLMSKHIIVLFGISHKKL